MRNYKIKVLVNHHREYLTMITMKDNQIVWASEQSPENAIVFSVRGGEYNNAARKEFNNISAVCGALNVFGCDCIFEIQ